tara:strand:+ start:12019 stop:12288 length:270 start_codon:yes stop_codon:yes gene_type:complete
MPYIERTGKKTIKEQLYQWFGVMTDPRIDGFNGFACKQKIYEVKWECERILESEKCPTYAGEEEWVQEQKDNKAIKRISGEHDSIPYYD